MALARDTTSLSSSGSSSSRTLSHTCSGSDRLLLVAIYITDNFPGIVTGVTYAGVAMTLIDYANWPGSAVASAAIYALVNPATGANNIVASYSGSVFNIISGVSYTGADQTSPIDSHANYSASAVNPAVMATTVVASNCWIAGLLASSSGGTFTPTSGTTVAQSFSSLGEYIGILDSNGIVGTGSQSLGGSQSGGATYRGAIVSIKPSGPPPPEPPVLDTLAVTSITTTTATGNGEITDIGIGDATARGFVFGTSTLGDPGDVAPAATSYDDYTTESGTFGAATFTGSLTGLSASTTYYVRAWAQNGDGYAYGDEVSFSTSATPPFRFTNLPGTVYDALDTQTIYAERLNDILERLEALE